MDRCPVTNALPREMKQETAENGFDVEDDTYAQSISEPEADGAEERILVSVLLGIPCIELVGTPTYSTVKTNKTINCSTSATSGSNVRSLPRDEVLQP